MRSMTSSIVRSEKSAVNSPRFMSVCEEASRELVQVIKTDARAFQRRPVPHILLDVIMLHARLGSRRKDLLPVDHAVADFSERIALESVCGRLEARLEILDVQHDEPRSEEHTSELQ